MTDDIKDPWLELAKDAYLSSTSYFDNNYRTKIEDNIRMFQGKHHSGSKYNKSAFKYRSKLFRPKTRSAERNTEAAAASVFLRSPDSYTIEARNQSDPLQQAAAELMHEVVTYRLAETIPWYMTLMGAYQDAHVVGVVASFQSWKYREKKIRYKQEVEDMDGNLLVDKADVEETIVLCDKPTIELDPIENIRFHPAADWRDPVNTSPYFIRMVPMYVQDIKQRMKDDDTKTGRPKWKELTDGEILSATKQRYDSTRQVREGNREDKTDNERVASLKDYDVAWCHMNFIIRDGEDYFFWTLGVEHILTEPMLVEEAFPHLKKGERPEVMGVGLVEAHKLLPDSRVTIGAPVQKEINEIVNQRLDNVYQVLNKRWFVKRGANVDIRSILRNVAGSVTMMNNVDGDVRPVDFADVTGSSYQEQDRLNVDFDELVGTFSAGSVQSNRKLNETVGGMEMLRGGVNQLTEYDLMTFGETWVEPVIKQLVKLEQAYETDTVLLGICADKAKLFVKYGVDEVTDELLSQDLTIRVNVGVSATDPMLKLEKFLMGVTKSVEISQVAPPEMDIAEVQKEIWGRLGYKDGQRFYHQEGDPKTGRLLQIIQQLQKMSQDMARQLDDKQADRQLKLFETEMKEKGQNKRKLADLNTKVLIKRMDITDKAIDRRITFNDNRAGKS